MQQEEVDALVRGRRSMACQRQFGIGKGSDYAWADAHVSFASWKTMSAGKNAKIDWYYMLTP